MAFTFFFRDAQTLELLVESAVPALRGQAFIRVWSAGCAHGPEPFTLAMMLRERMSEFLFRNVTIHATDVDPGFATGVESGVFAGKELQRMPRGLLGRYFEPGPAPGTFRVVEEVRRRVTFQRHDLLSLVPIRHELSLIVCKNVLLHFEERERVEVVRMFHGALRPDGLLAMEHTQKLPDALAPFFRQVAPHAQVYRKVEPAFVEHQAEEAVPHRRERRPADAPSGTPGVQHVAWFAGQSGEGLNCTHEREKET